jgi:hypothetical protein
MQNALFPPTSFSHRQVVEIAYKWLLKSGGVGFGFKELKSIDSEIPDVIGFDSWQSIMIEVKVSRSDFLADKKKAHRAKGMGNWRFYCCPQGLIKVDELPEKWGLIYVNEKGKVRIEYDCRKKKIKEPCLSDWAKKEYPEGFFYRTVSADENRFDADMVAERRIMYTALRRLHLRNRIEEIYAITNPTEVV